MKKELVNIDFEDYVNFDVKIFCKSKNKPEPITGKVLINKKKFIIVLVKKAIRQERKIVYKRRSIKKENIDRINLI